MNRSPPRSHRPTRDLHIPPECRDMIRRGALVAINSSGGKDSQAMTILLARIVLRDQLVVVHAPLREVEWPDTIEHIENTIPSGVPLIFALVASGKSLLVRFEERDRFPGPQQRYCTRDMKVPPTSTPIRYVGFDSSLSRAGRSRHAIAGCAMTAPARGSIRAAAKIPLAATAMTTKRAPKPQVACMPAMTGNTAAATEKVTM